MKRKICIEKLLKWAYCEELPKAGSAGSGVGPRFVSSGSTWARFEELLTNVDDNKYGVVPEFVPTDEPHADAIEVHAAVCRISDLELDLPNGWNPMPELEDMGREGEIALSAAINGLTKIGENGNRQLKRPVCDLILKHAVLGGRPDGSGPVPEVRQVSGENGGPLWFRQHEHVYYDDYGNRVKTTIEVDDGWDKFRKRPKQGAYTKSYLDPDPVRTLEGRGEYEIWVAAVTALAEDLQGKLANHILESVDLPVAPWERPEILLSSKPRILRANSV